MDQIIRFGGRAVATDLRSPDFRELAAAHRARGLRVERLPDVPAAVAEALASRQPRVTESPIEQVSPPWIR